MLSSGQTAYFKLTAFVYYMTSLINSKYIVNKDAFNQDVQNAEMCTHYV